jgi:hypothetical protein
VTVHPYLADLLDETKVFVRRFVVVGDTELDAIALWNAHTYVYDCAPATPYLHPHSPEPGSGKTTLLDLLELTACKAIQADGLSEAALFRLVDQRHPTLLFDEVDAVFGKKNSDSTEGIRQVLNSGYRKDKKVWRCVPPSHNVEPFDVYGPKATAGLHELPPTLAHRSIPISMQPPLPTDSYEDLDREEVADEAEILQRNLLAWAEESQDALRARRLKPERLPGLDARGNEIWRILFRIADMAGGDWPERARAAAIALSGATRRHQDTSTGVRLLGHIRHVFLGERMTCAAIVEALNADDQLPYGGWSDGKGISAREVGKKLAPYLIVAKPIRIDGVRAGNGYEREQFETAWDRYLPGNDVPNRYTGTTRTTEPKTGEKQPVQESGCTGFQNGANPHEQRNVPNVPVSMPEYGNEGDERTLDEALQDPLFIQGLVDDGIIEPPSPSPPVLPPDAPEWERNYWARRTEQP